MSAPPVAADTTGSMAIFVLALVFPVVATIFIGLRFAARKVQRVDYGADDWVILSSLVPLWGQTAINMWSVFLGGIGHHVYTLQPSNVAELFKSIVTLQFSFGLSLGLIKTAIVLFLMRIFVTPGFKKAAWVVIGYIICWTLMCIFIGAAVCRPFARNWDPTIEGECGNQLAAYIAIAALDIVGDLMIIALPMPKIWKLHKDTASKILVSSIFALGIFDIAVAILRIIYLAQLLVTEDFTYAAVTCWAWSVLEPCIAVMIACAPTLRPLFNRFSGSKRHTASYQNEASSYKNTKRSRQNRSDIGLESLHSEADFDGRGADGPNTYNVECDTASIRPQMHEKEKDKTASAHKNTNSIIVHRDIEIDYRSQ